MTETETENHCTFVNAGCPDDLCVLEYGHPYTEWRHHLTGSMYGSANTEPDEQIRILRSKESRWPLMTTYMAPQGTPVAELIWLGWELQDKLIRAGKLAV